jgi:hypothetical protein
LRHIPLRDFTSPEECQNLPEPFSPAFLTVFNDDDRLALKQIRDFWELADELALDTEPNSSTTEENVHSLIEGLRVIYG